MRVRQYMGGRHGGRQYVCNRQYMGSAVHEFDLTNHA